MFGLYCICVYIYSRHVCTVSLISVHLFISLSFLLQFYSPDIFTGGLPKFPDGFTLQLMFIPACSLTGPITVVGKPTLGTAVQLSLVTETAVAHLSGKTERETRNTESSWVTQQCIFFFVINKTATEEREEKLRRISEQGGK